MVDKTRKSWLQHYTNIQTVTRFTGCSKVSHSSLVQSRTITTSWCVKSVMFICYKDRHAWFIWEMNSGLLAFINIHKSNRQMQQPRCLLIHCSNWESLALRTTHNQTWGGSRPRSQLWPLSLMSLNDFNILPCHNLANRCQFSVTTRPIGYLPELWPRNNDDVQFNISVNLYSQASKQRKEGGGFTDDILIYIWKWTLTFSLLANWSEMMKGPI